MNYKKAPSFTLLELIVAAGSMVVIAAIAVASSIAVVRVQQVQKQTSLVTTQINRIIQEIELDFNESSIGELSSGVAQDITGGSYAVILPGGPDEAGSPRNSGIMIKVPINDFNGVPIIPSVYETKYYCRYSTTGANSGSGLARYIFRDASLADSSSLDINTDYCNKDNLLGPLGILKQEANPSLSAAGNWYTTLLTNPSVKIRYFRVTPVWFDGYPLVSPTKDDLKFPAIKIEIAAVYNPDNFSTSNGFDDSEQNQIVIEKVIQRCLNLDQSKCKSFY